ncbi:MAG TPA: alpha/beta fold hydrolase [Longimicrobium sp.]|nr:alpha/beta fold hydrolase [Longimicrobium sp.]
MFPFPSAGGGPSFRDRRHAGQRLAARLRVYAGRPRLLVLALPRGGVPVGYEVARALGAPLDVFLVRKLGVPGHEELAMGAIASGGVRVINDHVVSQLRVPPEVIDRVAEAETRELERREAAYRGGRPAPRVEGCDVILVDDGLATGATMRAAAAALRAQNPRRLIVAVPVAAGETCRGFRDAGEADEIVCDVTPDPFYAVGMAYEDFGQTTDEEVRELLARAAAEREKASAAERRPPEPGDAAPPRREGAEGTDGDRRVRVPAGKGISLEGNLDVPPRARGVVLFAHGSGSSRHSSRNRAVAAELRRAGLGTLLIDLLTADEERAEARTGHLRFDIGLLAGRLAEAVAWLQLDAATRGLPIGLFGASTGGGAALVAAARKPDAVAAVVSRGGRPDLAGDALPAVRAPTLLVVGGRDEPVIALNQQAYDALRCEKRLEIVPGATHLFEEPGTLERVAALASEWFRRYLR